jgi:RHS repeat-associated protein/prepilin-type processing-associated H-X9-DG protein
MEVKYNGIVDYTVNYFGAHEIVEPYMGSQINIYYLSGPNGVIGMERDNQIYYFLKDHLGSIMTIADADGDALEFLSYDAWGRRRNASDWTYSNVSTSAYTNRGYTGHEHIIEVDLINMNGRVNDPSVGMFLSPDQVIQSPGNALNYNRYSYCLNNPLKPRWRGHPCPCLFFDGHVAHYICIPPATH